MSEPELSRDVLLTRRFVTLADTLVDEFDVADLLEQLVHATTELLPVEHAGLLLLDEFNEAHLVASTSETTRLLEYFQLQSGEGGPCLECLRRGIPVSVDDLTTGAQQWPEFSRLGMKMGFGAVHALPLRLRQDVIGALNLFSSPGRLTQTDLVVAQSLADMATIGILQQRTTHRSAIEAEQLQRALNSRVVIEQAKGIMAEFGDLDMESAFAALRAYSRDNNLKIGEVAKGLVERSLKPSTVLGRRAAGS